MNELTCPLTAAEELELQARLWQALTKKAALYTSGRSTSLHENTARALLASIQFSLELYFSEQGLSFTAVLTQDIDDLLSAAEATVARAVKRVSFQYERACRCAFQDESLTLMATLRGIRPFFRQYDHRFFAAECPCDIDYPLACPVPDTLQGVVYLRVWLDCLLTEDTFLRRFPPRSVRRVLAAVEPEHRALPVNLYDITAAAALGVTLAEGDLSALIPTPLEYRNLTARFHQCSPEECRQDLRQAADTLGRRLGLNAADAAYLCKTAENLAPRLTAAGQAGDLRNLFPIAPEI